MCPRRSALSRRNNLSRRSALPVRPDRRDRRAAAVSVLRSLPAAPTGLFPPPLLRAIVALLSLSATLILSAPAPLEAAPPLQAAAPGSGAEPAGEQEARIDAVFADYDDTRSPGCALGVAEPGGLAIARGYGMANLDHGVPLTPSSVFRIASVSKQFTAAVTLLLERDGHLTLDDDVRTHLPELPDLGSPVRVRDLIHHTSGIRDYLTLMSLAGRRSDDFYTDEEVMEMLSRQEGLNFSPGERHLYSNSGYFLVSRLVPRLTDRSLRAYADEHLFGPLGMARTHFHDDHSRIVEGRATGYAPRGEGGFAIQTTRLNLVGDGGVFTSVEELETWERIFLATDPGEIPGADPDLARLLRDRMPERGVLADGDTLDYAFGLVHGSFRGLRTVGHGGSFVGYRTQILRFPDQRVSIVVLCNRRDADPGRLAREVAGVVLEEVLEPAAEEEEPGEADSPGDEAAEVSPEVEAPEDASPVEPPDRGPPAPGLSAAELRSLAGAYRSEELDVTWTLEVEDGRLHLASPPSLRSALAPTDEEDRFRAGGLTLRFLRDEAGAVRELRVDAGRALGLRFEPGGGRR